jgi:GAF domain-containing protein
MVDMKRPRATAGKAAGKVRRKGAGAKRSSRAASPRTTRAAELQRQLAEAHAQQAATGEVLKAISRSRGEPEPVFQAILERAVRLCEARFGTLFRYDGENFHRLAGVGTPPALVEYQKQRGPFRPRGSGTLARLLRTRKVVHSDDSRTDPDPGVATRVGGARSIVGVPMLENNKLAGALVIYRQEVRPFTERQIELLKQFAAQAVIAIENARLLNELRESLQQQTATAEVLKVISSSPGALEPVFNAMLENATRICEAKFGTLYLRDGSTFRAAAFHNAPPEFVAHRLRGPIDPSPDSTLGRVVRTRQVAQVLDSRKRDGYTQGDPFIVAGAELGGYRTIVSVPMLKDDDLIGVMSIYRQEIQAFTDKQIELLTNFAAQAVIAIENTRLLSELRQRTDDLSESLEQQTATSEVLKIISSSPGELDAVFQAMLVNATRICDAKFGIMYEYAGGKFRARSCMQVPPAYADYVTHWRDWGPGTGLSQVARTRQIVHTHDVAESRAYAEGDPDRVATVELGGVRTSLVVPMLKDGDLGGAFVIYRQEVRPFTGKQIELMSNFAAQAVIAIENARLLNELRDSLQRQTATSEVLKVISSSPGELEPVFQAMLSNAMRICEASFGIMFRFADGAFRGLSWLGIAPEFAKFLSEPRVWGPGTGLGRVANTKRAVHVDDAVADRAYAESDPGRLAAVNLGGARSFVIVPMLKEGELVGAFSIFRQEVKPFTEKQIDLVSNFAAQAVIAIENARLLSELRQRTDDLSESLEHQTATSEVLNVISRSPTDAQPVFNAIVESAARLCEAVFSVVWLYDGDLLRVAASDNFTPEAIKKLVQTYPKRPDRTTLAGRAVLDGRIAHAADLLIEPGYAHDLARAGNWRASASVPMLRDGKPIGAISVGKHDPVLFSDRQVQLLTTFADQAVIAIENVRLFDEVQKRTDDLTESLAQQIATSDVLKVISRSTFDLQIVLDTLTASAARLCDADKAFIFRREGSGYRLAANFGFSQEFKAYLEQHLIMPGRDSLVGRTVSERLTVHIPDVLVDPEYTWREAIERGEIRTMLGVPLMRGGAPIGVFQMTRATVRPFTAKQIDLIESFADQAVIAIENVRLFDEIQDKSRQLAEASQHKSQFLASMSHELRTPLNAILGYTELIADGIYGAPPEKMQTVLKRVESNGRHLLGLINAVLDLSKIEAGQLTLELADYSLQNVAQTVYNAVEPLAADKKLAFKADIEPGLPAGRGDERRLTQVLLNLVGNAIKFTDAGEVVIKAGASNGDFHLSVHDTGPGISAADQAKLFQEFQQASNPATRKKEGTGLGLAISKRIVEMHGGRIWIESQLGHGSTFFVTLPVQVSEQVSEHVLEQAKPLPG